MEEAKVGKLCQQGCKIDLCTDRTVASSCPITTRSWLGSCVIMLQSEQIHPDHPKKKKNYVSRGQKPQSFELEGLFICMFAPAHNANMSVGIFCKLCGQLGDHEDLRWRSFKVHGCSPATRVSNGAHRRGPVQSDKSRSTANCRHANHRQQHGPSNQIDVLTLCGVSFGFLSEEKKMS